MTRAMNDRMAGLLAQAGIKTTSVKIFGQFAHVDTFAKYEPALRELFAHMGATSIQVARVGADGRTIDGKKTHRLIARFDEVAA